jgi:hypothetical protein
MIPLRHQNILYDWTGFVYRHVRVYYCKIDTKTLIM